MKWILAVSRHNFLPDGGAAFRTAMREYPSPCGVVFHDNGSPGLLAKAFAAWSAGARACAGALLASLAGMRSSPWEDPDGIPSVRSRSLDDPKVLDFVRELAPDVGIHVRTRCRLGDELLSLPRLGWVNVHHGLLPRDRGTSCDLAELREGRDAGFSLHRMVPQLDAGEILGTVVVEAGICRDYAGYLERSALREAQAVGALLGHVSATGRLPEAIQNRCDAVRWCRTPGWRQLRRIVAVEGFRL